MPISILPTLSKIIEKIHLMSYLNKYQLLHKNQSGLRKNHSTESALILMTDTWLKAINEGKLVGCAMIDFRKAFALVDHKLLHNKLDIYRFSALSLSWFKSYLSTYSTSGYKQFKFKNWWCCLWRPTGIYFRSSFIFAVYKWSTPFIEKLTNISRLICRWYNFIMFFFS